MDVAVHVFPVTNCRLNVSGSSEFYQEHGSVLYCKLPATDKGQTQRQLDAQQSWSYNTHR